MSDKVVPIRHQKTFGETKGMSLIERAEWISAAVVTGPGISRASVIINVRSRALAALLEHEESVLAKIPHEGKINEPVTAG